MTLSPAWRRVKVYDVSRMENYICNGTCSPGWTEDRGAKWGMPLESHVPCFQERVDTGRLK
jgi:hypothetical protein